MKLKRTRKALDWHLGDIEQRFGFSGAKYTDVNMMFAAVVTAVIVGGLYFGVCHLPRQVREVKYIQMILERGWTPYVMVVLFVLALVIMFVKWRKLCFQRRAFKLEIIPVGNEFALTPQSAKDVIAALNANVDDPKRFVLFNRIERSLLNLRNIGNVSDVSEMLRAQAENDESRIDTSYGILGGIVWMIPILGFIGTVIGLSGAIGGFGAVLNSDANINSLKSGLAPVTANLGIAFDTTFVALVLAMVIQGLIAILRKKEEVFLDECRDYANMNVIAKLRIDKENQETKETEIEM